MDRGCATYENGISESYHNAIRIYRVRKVDESFGVNIETRTCTYKWWDLNGVPCVHSIAAFCFLKIDPLLGVSVCVDKSEVDQYGGGTTGVVPSNADPTGEGLSDAGAVPSTKDETVIEDSIAIVIEDAIASGVLKDSKSEKRVQVSKNCKKSKTIPVLPDGTGSSFDKAWNVDNVLEEW
ncbi:60S ribosomal protein L34 [Tanacetum coccineum]